MSMWVNLLVTLIPEIVRGIIAIAKEHYAVKKAEAEAKKTQQFDK
jgi:hypothetical protein